MPEVKVYKTTRLKDLDIAPQEMRVAAPSQAQLEQMLERLSEQGWYPLSPKLAA